MKFLPQIGDIRIRKLHGSWCVQRYTAVTATKDGQTHHFALWELLSSHSSHAKAVAAVTEAPEYDEGDHHLEPCS